MNKFNPAIEFKKIAKRYGYNPKTGQFERRPNDNITRNSFEAAVLDLVERTKDNPEFQAKQVEAGRGYRHGGTMGLGYTPGYPDEFLKEIAYRAPQITREQVLDNAGLESTMVKGKYKNYDYFGNGGPMGPPTYEEYYEYPDLPELTIDENIDDTSLKPSWKDMLPGMIAQGAGTLAKGYLLARNKPEYVTPEAYTPENINLEPQRQQVRRDATTARNISLRNLRGLGKYGYLSNAGAAIANINRVVGDQMSQSYLNESTANVGERNKARLVNMQNRQRANEINTQERTAYQNAIQNLISEAVGDITGISKDIAANKLQYNIAQLIQQGRYYGIYRDKDGNYKVRLNDGSDLSVEEILRR